MMYFNLAIVIFLFIVRRSQGSLQDTAEVLYNFNYEFKSWVDNDFYSSDPTWQRRCSNILKTELTSPSQFGQDIFTFLNLFKMYAMTGKRGFYVESGANDATSLSNTLFYDKCLGWDGLCIEPNPIYANGFKKRSCTYVPKCISSETKVMYLSNKGTTSEVSNVSTGNIQIECATLNEIMDFYRPDIKTIDLWSLDVEGYEMTVLKSVDLGQLNINALIIEDFWLTNRNLNYFMTTHNYILFQQMNIDSLFLSHDFFNKVFNHKEHKHYIPGFRHYWKKMSKYRNRVRSKLAPC